MTKVTCNHCQKNLDMIDANWIFIDETKPGTADNMEWCCDKCLDKIEENSDKQCGQVKVLTGKYIEEK